MPAFPGLPSEGIAFLRALKKHNDRDWFQARKHIYEEQVKAPMLALISSVNAEFMKFAPDYVSDPAKALFRIYRDTRFSNDKTPYKTHAAAAWPRRGLPRSLGGFYVSVAPDKIEIAGGVYHPDVAQLLAIRTLLAERHEEFRKTYETRKVRQLMGELQGDRLTRAPKGFDPKHPAADLLRYKDFVLFVDVDPAIAVTPDLFYEIVQRFRVMKPFVEFLSQAL